MDATMDPHQFLDFLAVELLLDSSLEIDEVWLN